MAKNTTYSTPSSLEGSKTPHILRRPNDTVLYVVDESGAGTHKTVESAIADAKKHPNRRTMVTIRPHTTIENFNRPSESEETYSA